LQIKELRELNDMRQRDMAKLLSISPCNYSKKENGNIRFTLEEAKTIADYFNKDIEEIFFESKRSKMERNIS
jgi:putative transcriptional regulator